MLRIAHLSDTHLDGEDVPRARLAQVATAIRAMADQPDLIIVTGDISERSAGVAAARELPWIASTLGSEVPVLFCPGNSDDRDAFRSFLGGRGDRFDVAGDQTHQATSIGNVLVLAVDSNVRGEFFGRLHPDSIAWIRDQLDATDRDRAILAMHQPPAQLGHPIVDQLRLLDAEALEDVVANSPSVIATLCGHTHAAISTTFGGKPLLVAPGVHSWGQVPLEFTEPNAGLIKEDSPPGFAVHLIDGRRVVTYFEVCPERR